MYIGAGDARHRRAARHPPVNPQRLDTLVGKILRIVPDLRAHTATSTVSENGRYRIPNDNPFATVEGARKEIWAYGLRNPHRLTWDVDPPAAPNRACSRSTSASPRGRRSSIVQQGRQLRLPAREGTQAMTPQGMAPVPADDTIPVQITDTVARGTVKPTYPGDCVPAHRAAAATPSPAASFIAEVGPGAERQAALRRHHDRPDLVRRDGECSRPTTATRRRSLRCTSSTPVSAAWSKRPYRARGGKGDALPGAAAVSGRGRVDLRFAEDEAGELYVLTKTDGMIRQVVGVK